MEKKKETFKGRNGFISISREDLDDIGMNGSQPTNETMQTLADDIETSFIIKFGKDVNKIMQKRHILDKYSQYFWKSLEECANDLNIEYYG